MDVERLISRGQYPRTISRHRFFLLPAQMRPPFFLLVLTSSLRHGSLDIVEAQQDHDRHENAGESDLMLRQQIFADFNTLHGESMRKVLGDHYDSGLNLFVWQLMRRKKRTALDGTARIL